MGGIGDLIVWREAALLSVRVEEAAQTFSGYGATDAADQMIRAANSVCANIAEGYGRGVTRDGLRFFRIAHASADELECHLRLALMHRRFAPEHGESLIDHSRRVGFLIHRFEQSLQRRLDG